MSPEGAEKFEPEPDGDADDKPDFEGTKEEGEKKDKPEKKDDDKKDGKFAGLRHFAAKEPEAIEDAIQDIFLGMDEAMAEVEALANDLGVDLVVPEVGENPDDPDAGLHGEMPVGGEGDLVEFSGTADPETAKVMFDAGAEASDGVETEEEEPEEEFTIPQ